MLSHVGLHALDGSNNALKPLGGALAFGLAVDDMLVGIVVGPVAVKPEHGDPLDQGVAESTGARDMM